MEHEREWQDVRLTRAQVLTLNVGATTWKEGTPMNEIIAANLFDLLLKLTVPSDAKYRVSIICLQEVNAALGRRIQHQYLGAEWKSVHVPHLALMTSWRIK